MVSSLPPTTLFSEPSSIRRPLCIDIDGTLRNLAHRKELLAALRASHSEGRRLVILTSADATIARQAYADLSLFDDCLGLTREGPDTSKKGLLLSAHGEKGFDCLGDSSTDIGIFEAASQAFVWGASAKTRARVSHLKHVTILSRLPSLPRAVIKQPKVLLLDEAFSGLPEEEEAKIVDRIRVKLPELTLIAATHRLASLQKAQAVIRL